jgi:6-phosphogluconolactonase/glucosamine-6-phosphate isomerase/deaminase
MGSRRVLLVVSGAHKREVLARLLNGGLTTALPGSLLRMHPDALCLCDRAAAGALA